MTQSKTHKILAVDDHASTRHLYSSYLKPFYRIDLAAGGAEALQKIKTEQYDLYVTDLIMPGMDGIQFIRALRKIHPDAPVIVVSQTDEIDLAIGAFREHPLEFLRKPLKKSLFLAAVERCLDRANLQRENRNLRHVTGTDAHCPEPVTGKSSTVMTEFWDRVRTTAESPLAVPVLITGESGVGKEVVARQIHRWSRRHAHAFVAVNCGLLTPQLAAGDLMGVEKGVATGVDPRQGKFQAAEGGTLFLDEITELPGDVQTMLLRTLQEKTIMALGSHTETAVDVRVIAATNQDLKERVRDGRFREDLFYRLSVLTLDVPPLRRHPEDIPDLLTHLLKRHGGGEALPLEPDEHREWMAYAWPGNIRQLENALLQRLVTGKPIHLEQSAATSELPPTGITDYLQAGWEWDRIKTEIFREALRQTNGNLREAARKLGIPKTTMWEYCREKGLLG